MSRQPISQLLGELEGRVLGVLLLRPEKAWYRSELARELSVPPSSLQRVLIQLVSSGILMTHKDGNRLYYQADIRSPIFPEMRGLLAKTSGLVGVLKDALSGVAGQVDFAFVYGSMASGEAAASSDVDLLIVGTARRAQLARTLREAGDRLGREINPTFYSPQEFAKKLGTGEKFLRAVLDKPKLFVLGVEDVIDLGKPSGPKARRPGGGRPGRD